MKLVLSAIRSANVVSCRAQLPWTIRSIFTGDGMDDSKGGKSYETADDFERRIFGDGMDDSKGGKSYETADDFERRIFGGAVDNNSKLRTFFDKLDRLGKARGRSGVGSREIGGASEQLNEGLRKSFDTLSDGMDAKLKKAATTFDFTDEIKDDDYSFRPDVKFQPGMTYMLRDLDLTKPAAQKPYRRPEFQTTTEEVLKKADFRNVRFLSNFLTEAGLIIKRSKTRISAKAQRKVAREIKTARALGLLPFTTMGTKQFHFGKSMEDHDEDMEYSNFYSQPVTDYFEEKRNM